MAAHKGLVTCSVAMSGRLLGACGGAGEPEPNMEPEQADSDVGVMADGDDQVGVEPVCESATWTLDLPEDGTTVEGVWPSSGAILLRSRPEDGSIQLDLVDESGPSRLASIPDGAGWAFGVEPVEWRQQRCAVASLSTETLRLICEDGMNELSEREASAELFPVVGADGTIHVFTQTFASYTELRRTSDGWREIEKYESSISKPTDAILRDGRPVSCFIDNTRHAVLDGMSSEPRSAEPASECLITSSSQGIHVLADGAYALVAEGATSFETSPLALDERVVELVTVDDGPVVVTQTAEGVVMRALPGLEVDREITFDEGFRYEGFALSPNADFAWVVSSMRVDEERRYVVEKVCLD